MSYHLMLTPYLIGTYVQAVAIPHYSITSNVVQTATHIRNNDPTVPWKDRRMRDGDVASCALPMFRECE